MFEMIRDNMGRLADALDDMRKNMATRDDIAMLTKRTEEFVPRRDIEAEFAKKGSEIADVRATANAAVSKIDFETWKRDHFDPVRNATKETVPWKVLLGIGGAIGGLISIGLTIWNAIPHKG